MVTGRPIKRFLAGNRLSRDTGFTYVVLLFAVAIASIAMAGTGTLWQMESRREKEMELLFIGEQYRMAISSYYAKTPGGEKQYPVKLEDLILDKRFPNPATHLRRLYRDPMMADGQWELIRQQGRIIGIASRSIDRPIKIAGFLPVQEGFETAEKYSGWRFLSNGSGNPSAPVAAPVNGSAANPVNSSAANPVNGDNADTADTSVLPSSGRPSPLPRSRAR
jgi:type II secretory pathway pseudopilin PulG